MFGKPKPPAAPPVAEKPKPYAWDRPDRKSQQLRIDITQWSMECTPKLGLDSGAYIGFSMTGVVMSGEMKGCNVNAEIERVDDVREHKPNADNWPDDRWHLVEGTSYFSWQSDDFLGHFGVTLYCRQAALEWLHQTVTNGLHGRHGRSVLELWMDSPIAAAPALWAGDGWKNTVLRVTSWKVYSGASVAPIT
jgi:hypothetical protein